MSFIIRKATNIHKYTKFDHHIYIRLHICIAKLYIYPKYKGAHIWNTENSSHLEKTVS